ncbi:lytic transglycosylase domain-containing protein [Sphingoaurantiacus capsulatus]|uniref:Lytic transglycosylase domain-containing protein n=1 Tax=Sphingoaurantiacus capsulatus TaxID=1771310 RepID=A0ABV7XFV0_9SPHN
MRKLVTALLLAAAPVAAQAEAISARFTAAQQAVPAQLDAASRAAYTQAFRDLDAGRTAAAEAAIAAHPTGVLTPLLQAGLLLKRKNSAATLGDFARAHTDLPQSQRVADAARAAGATDLPMIPASRSMRVVSYTAPMSPRSARADAAGQALAQVIKPLLAADRVADAEAAWRSRSADVVEPSRSEWAQRIAWNYYTDGDDAGALRMGAAAGDGSGEWAAMGNWVAGLAAYRADNCVDASAHFDKVAGRGGSADLRAAGAFWASRAFMACGKPQEVSARLRTAASYGDSFYGLLAAHTLGQTSTNDWAEPDFIQADWNHLAKLGGARRAAALVEIGQLGLADRELKHLAATGDPANYEALLRLSARLNLPATQYWLAHRPPAGASAPMTARFPAPAWTPYRGWRVDPSLVFAHALQESNFQTDATSRVGARGLMQLMPGTAKDLCREMGEAHDPARLADPSFNIELGQSYLEGLRDSTWTQGLLPKVIAAYNAGPGSVKNWNTSLNDKGDPLLFIESIPFVETRHYVEVVLRNYWMYQQRAGNGAAPESLKAVAQGLWPRFPGLPGATAVKAEPNRAVVRAD